MVYLNNFINRTKIKLSQSIYVWYFENTYNEILKIHLCIEDTFIILNLDIMNCKIV